MPKANCRTQSDWNNYSDAHNPNSPTYQQNLDNHANQLNPNNDAYWG